MALYDILGDRKTQTVRPEENEGLLIDLSDPQLAKTMVYLDALTDERQAYTDFGELPAVSALSERALAGMRALWRMGRDGQVGYWPEDNDPYVRARWFAEGSGRVYIGYAEAMTAMGECPEDVIVRRFSYGPGANVSLFYTDMVGIAAGIAGEKKALALELADLLISGRVLTGMSLPAEDGAPPQYLLTARRSVYDALSMDYPVYSRLKEIAESGDNHVFRLGADARAFLQEMEAALTEALARAGAA